LDCCPGTRIRRRETEDDGFEKAELEQAMEEPASDVDEEVWHQP